MEASNVLVGKPPQEKLTQKEILLLKKFAAQIRLELVKEVGHLGFGHLGGALSVVDALAVLYGGVMKIDPQNPDLKDRDKLVMSKGHAGPAIYATLALKGYFPMEWLLTLNKIGTRLPSHCDRRLTPGIDMTTGSLGQGVSSAIGLALANQMDDSPRRVFLFTGDGELDEGQVWEGAMFAANHNLSNLVWFIDNNKRQLDGYIEDVFPLGDIAAKTRAFGWNTICIDGSDVEAIYNAICAADQEKDKPTCIILDTIKGAGVKAVYSVDINHHIQFKGVAYENSLAECQAKLSEIDSELQKGFI